MNRKDRADKADTRGWRRAAAFLTQNRQILLFLLFIGNAAGYFLSQRYAGMRTIVHTQLDDRIPFVPVFIIPYILWYAYVPALMAVMCFYDKKNFFRQCAVVFGGMYCCIAIFLLFPTAIDFRPAISGGGLLNRLCAMIYASDQPFNVFPSEHCYEAIAVHFTFFASGRLPAGSRRVRLLRGASGLLVLLICASTVFVKQHSIADFFGAAAVFLLLYFAVYGKELLRRCRRKALEKKTADERRCSAD